MRSHEVSRIVIGLPLHMDGREGPEAEAARRFGADVGHATGLPVEFLDERWSSREAERVLRESGGGRGGDDARGHRRDKGDVDRVAAALLLQTFLERSR